MLEPLARVYERSVPAEPADAGLFGPGGIAWRVHRDRSFPLAGMRALMVQALHPLAMAGVAQHSDWQRDPFGRLAATSGYVLTVTYGDIASANEAAARVRAVHKHVRGTDPETGLPYAAEDPDLLLWIHAALVESIMTIVQRYGRGLDPADGDRYVAEMVPFAEIVGVPGDMVPRASRCASAAATSRVRPAWSSRRSSAGASCATTLPSAPPTTWLRSLAPCAAC